MTLTPLREREKARRNKGIYKHGLEGCPCNGQRSADEDGGNDAGQSDIDEQVPSNDNYRRS